MIGWSEKDWVAGGVAGGCRGLDSKDNMGITQADDEWDKVE